MVEDLAVSIFGLLLIVFSIGFSKSMRSLLTTRRLILVSVLLVLAGAGGVLAGIFTESIPALHALGALFIFGFSPVAQLLAGSKLRRIPGLQWYGEYTMINGAVAIGLDVFATFHPILNFAPPLIPFVNALDTQFTGLYQRLQMIFTWNWYTVSGLRSLRLEENFSSPSKTLSANVDKSKI